MTKIETLQCDVCEKMREPGHFGGQQWLEVYWTEQGDIALHVCGNCVFTMERLLLRLGFHVEIPCMAGPDTKRLDRIVISWVPIREEEYPNEFAKKLFSAMSKVYGEATNEST